MSADSTRPLDLRGFDGSGAAVNVGFPLEEVFQAFREQIDKEWQKRSRGLALHLPVAMEGNFVRIDEGKRWMRYLLTFIGGHAVVEVEGRCLLDGRVVDSFHFTEKSAGGLFGGNSQSLITLCAEGAARKIVRQLVQKIESSAA